MLVLTLVVLGWTTDCTGSETETAGTGEETTTQEETSTTLPEGGVPTYAYGQLSGNQFVGDGEDLPNSRPVDVHLGGEPV